MSDTVDRCRRLQERILFPLILTDADNDNSVLCHIGNRTLMHLSHGCTGIAHLYEHGKTNYIVQHSSMYAMYTNLNHIARLITYSWNMQKSVL